jgi:hypothetical protein
VGTRLQLHSRQRRNMSFVWLRYRILLKVACCAQKIGFGVDLIQMAVDGSSHQTLILLE